MQAKFCIGQIVLNPELQYRAVIIDVDAEYAGTTTWYDQNMPHQPPKNIPWYHLLIHNAACRLYIA